MEKKHHNKPLFFDGAFGTYYSQITECGTPCEFANLVNRNTVYSIHKQYITAGASAIKTNTFGANSTLSASQNEIRDIIESGYKIAAEAADGTGTAVYADIGYINSNGENVSEEYLVLSKFFIGCGAKNFLFETFAEFDVLVPALQYIKAELPDSNIIVSFAVSQDGYSKKGHYYKDLILKATGNKNVNVVGLNCICGPSHLYNLIRGLDLCGKSFSAMPNSGYPSVENGRTVFQDNAEYFSQKLLDIHTLGVDIIGGCCGTTPEHIQLSIKKILGALETKSNTASGTSIKPDVPKAKNLFIKKLLSGQKVIAVELDPPINTESDYIIEASKRVKIDGADIVTLADSPLARTRADSVILAAKIKRENKIDVLPHISCRDKNHIGIKATLLGASIENINNVLVVTGDPVSQTDRGTYRGVFSFNSFDLISFIRSLNSEVFFHSPFSIGGALNVNSLNFETELERAKRKIETGADFLLTQAIFSDRAVANLRLAKKQLSCKILAGILPVAGYKNALFLNNEVKGIDIPENMLKLLVDKLPQEASEIAIEFCMGIIEKVADICDGYYLMTPLKRIDLICDLIKKIRSL